MKYIIYLMVLFTFACTPKAHKNNSHSTKTQYGYWRSDSSSTIWIIESVDTVNIDGGIERGYRFRAADTVPLAIFNQKLVLSYGDTIDHYYSFVVSGPSKEPDPDTFYYTGRSGLQYEKQFKVKPIIIKGEGGIYHCFETVDGCITKYFETTKPPNYNYIWIFYNPVTISDRPKRRTYNDTTPGFECIVSPGYYIYDSVNKKWVYPNK